MPVKRLTNVGGEFLDWADKGKAVTYALGRTFFRYDLDAAKAAEEKQKEEERKKAEEERSRRKKPEAGRRRTKRKKRRQEEACLRGHRDRNRRRGLRAPSRRARVVLRGARIITMKGNEVIENGDVVVKDNRIEAVGRRGQVECACRRHGPST